MLADLDTDGAGSVVGKTVTVDAGALVELMLLFKEAEDAREKKVAAHKEDAQSEE